MKLTKGREDGDLERETSHSGKAQKVCVLSHPLKRDRPLVISPEVTGTRKHLVSFERSSLVSRARKSHTACYTVCTVSESTESKR